MTTHTSPDSSGSLNNTVAPEAIGPTRKIAATPLAQQPALAPQTTTSSTSQTRRPRWPSWVRVLVYLSPILGVVLAIIALILQIIQVAVH